MSAIRAFRVQKWNGRLLGVGSSEHLLAGGPGLRDAPRLRSDLQEASAQFGGRVRRGADPTHLILGTSTQFMSPGVLYSLYIIVSKNFI